MPEANLSCYTRREDRSLILALEGTLDMATAPQALESLQRFMVENGPKVVVDTSRLDFIDSKGVGALLSAAKTARDLGGYIFMPNPATPVRKILEMCGLMPLFSSRPDAAASDAKPADAKPAPADPSNGAAAPPARPSSRAAKKSS
jgi:anti-anti-sigma factor